MKKILFHFFVVLINIMFSNYPSIAEYFLKTYIPEIDKSNYPSIEFRLIINDFERQETIIGLENCKEINNINCYVIEIIENDIHIDGITCKHYKNLDKNTEVLTVIYTSNIPKNVERKLVVRIKTPADFHNYKGDEFKFKASPKKVAPVYYASTMGFAFYVNQLIPEINPSESEIESVIKDIREKYNEIQSSEYTILEKEYTTGGGTGTIKTYYEDQELSKMVVEFYGDGASGSTEYFFWYGKPFFIFDKWETFRIWEEQTDVGRTEHRYYYDNYKLIRWLVKSYKDDFKPHYKSRDDKEFADKERAILKDVDNWLEFAISEQTDFETFMDNR